jgi:WD40-like Beta Propeller Repeat
MKRNGSLWAGIAALTAISLSGAEARAGDPYLQWFTVVTPHFRVSYHGGLEKEAQRVATLAEAIDARLIPELGWQPSEVTEILLTDVTDSANGSATALPYNAVRLFATAPDDLSPLGDYDDWYTELVTHEYTHILHVDNISGIPALVNKVLGKTSAPNQVQPRWVLEGLAVSMETEHTGGGRLRSTQFDMILRADVLEHRLARLDQISNSARRWPTGNLWYLYGGEFIGWISDVYGPETYGAVASDYGSNIIPWGINRSIRRATGRTYPELYRGWQKHLEDKYAAQMREVSRRGVREGTRLTHRGRIAASPRWVPACARTGPREEILYYVDDGQTQYGFWRVPLDARDRADEADAELVARASGHTAGYEPDCGFVYDSVAPSRRRYYFGDLFRQPKGTRSERGLSGSKRRLTVGRRARDPDVSPDGRQVVYVTNRAGTSTLRIADIDAEGDVQRERILVPSARYEQAFTPRFSHDGKRVAYSVWTDGGYRDVRVVEITTGKFYQVTHDTALDQEPSFSPDDAYVYFASDRSGISNVYAYEIATGKLSQVTNVKTGAYMPEVSPDARTLAYIGYSADGFDLYTLPLDRSRWLDPPPPPGPRPRPHPDPGFKKWPVESYDPLATLRPRAYTLDYGKGAFGDTLKVSTTGSDIAGLHSFSATILTAFGKGEPSGSINYAYHRLPFDFVLSAFRSAAPRKGYRYGEQEPIFTETFTGATTGIAYTEPGEFDAQTLALYYTIGEFDSTLPVANLGDPDALVPHDPHRGFLGLVSVGYGYSNADGTLYGIGPERGFSVGGGLDFAARETGSEETLTAVNARVSAYVPMPWARHHTLALNLEGASSVGSYPRRGLYYTGGFVTDQGLQGIVDAFDNGIRQSAFVLRGYEPAKFIGQQYNLANAEYRFPLLYADRGISTLPVFLRTLSATAFADYGGAFDAIDPEDPLSQYHLGVGGELWVDLVLGYHASGLIRIGYAKGFGDAAVSGGQTYVVVASAF